MGSEVKRSRVKFSNFRLAPVKGWVTSETREKVNGMSTVVGSVKCCACWVLLARALPLFVLCTSTDVHALWMSPVWSSCTAVMQRLIWIDAVKAVCSCTKHKASSWP